MDLFANWTELQEFLTRGGPAIWAISALSVLTMALIMWKIWRLGLLGAWSGKRTRKAIAAWEAGDTAGARSLLEGASSLRATVARHAIETQVSGKFTDSEAREDIQRVAKNQLSRARTGLRALELIATIAPRLGLLGTVLGMITAFQTLQAAGTRADPAALAGGIWEALLTTAAGMAVAIPAGVALAWFESVADRVQGDMEDGITRILLRKPGAARGFAAAAE